MNSIHAVTSHSLEFVGKFIFHQIASHHADKDQSGFFWRTRIFCGPFWFFWLFWQHLVTSQCTNLLCCHDITLTTVHFHDVTAVERDERAQTQSCLCHKPQTRTLVYNFICFELPKNMWMSIMHVISLNMRMPIYMLYHHTFVKCYSNQLLLTSTRINIMYPLRVCLLWVDPMWIWSISFHSSVSAS